MNQVWMPAAFGGASSEAGSNGVICASEGASCCWPKPPGEKPKSSKIRSSKSMVRTKRGSICQSKNWATKVSKQHLTEPGPNDSRDGQTVRMRLGSFSTRLTRQGSTENISIARLNDLRENSALRSNAHAFSSRAA